MPLAEVLQEAITKELGRRVTEVSSLSIGPVAIAEWTGNIYFSPIINNNSGISLLGNPKIMRKFSKYVLRRSKDSTADSRLLPAPAGVVPLRPPTPDPSDHSLHMEPSPEYLERDYDWFEPGRLFKIWADHHNEKDVEIHEKQFVLLDSKNIEGKGIRVRIYQEAEERAATGSFYRSHVLVKSSPDSDESNSQSQSQAALHPKCKMVFMDEYYGPVISPRTWIELEHSYNIPFSKYKCVDCGMLDQSSLQALRQAYVDWLKYKWGCK